MELLITFIIVLIAILCTIYIVFFLYNLIMEIIKDIFNLRKKQNQSDKYER
jgi:uncharacterized membrane protein